VSRRGCLGLLHIVTEVPSAQLTRKSQCYGPVHPIHRDQIQKTIIVHSANGRKVPLDSTGHRSFPSYRPELCSHDEFVGMESQAGSHDRIVNSSSRSSEQGWLLAEGLETFHFPFCAGYFSWNAERPDEDLRFLLNGRPNEIRRISRRPIQVDIKGRVEEYSLQRYSFVCGYTLRSYYPAIHRGIFLRTGSQILDMAKNLPHDSPDPVFG